MTDGPSVPASGGESSLKSEEWLDTVEAADYLRLPVGTLRNLVSAGRIPYHKLGRSNRYLKAELRQMLLATKRGGFNGN